MASLGLWHGAKVRDEPKNKGALMSKKNVPAILSAMGVFVEIISNLVKFVEEFGGTMGNIYYLAKPEGIETLKKVARVIVDEVKKWREESGVIYFSVITNGKSGPEWISYLESKGFCLSNYAISILSSPDFQPSKAGEVIEIALLKGKLWKNKENRTTKYIRLKAEKSNFSKPSAEVACLIREKFTDKEIEAMGLSWIVAMHEPIKGSDGVPSLLSAGRSDGGPWLYAYYDKSDNGWGREDGFAFVVAQVCP